MRVALVHDYLLVMRGAERTFAAMAELWPLAPIFTLLYDEEGTQGRFAGRTVVTSSLQRLGTRQANFRALLPLFPDAVQRFPLDGYDCVVSSSSAFAHGVRPARGARHICYCHSPFRYAWLGAEGPITVPRPLRAPLGLAMRRHRSFDRSATERVTQFVANSQITASRIERFWGRTSVIVNPPVDVERFAPDSADDYVLYVGELVRHKRAEDAIWAAGAAGRRIKVVGGGPERERLAPRFPDAEFLGRVSDEELARLYAHAAALVVPNVEEFGIAAVEAQAAGRPVVGVDAGGLRETVIPERTGILVDPEDPGALARALSGDLTRFDSGEIRRHAERFSRQAFQTRLMQVVEAVGDLPHAGAITP